MNHERLKAFLRGTGARIGRYEIERELGRGGMGIVYEAYDPKLRRHVAVKRLRPEAADRLMHEATAAARLCHPNVAQVYEAGPDHIVMELVDGPSLRARIPALSLRERVATLEVVARAIDHAHQQGVVHRDLKPANVLIAGGRVVVTDFGLAKVLDGEPTGETRAGVGTPDYMAPEQVSGGAVGPAADVWALGVMLYELAAGRLPFEGERPLVVFDRIVRAAPRPLPGPLGAICARALEKDPRRRHPTAAAFADDLARWLAGGRVRVPGALRRRVRGRRAVAAGAALVLAAAAGIWWRARPVDDYEALAAARVARLRALEDRHSRALEQNPTRVASLLDRAGVLMAQGDEARDHGRNPLAAYAAAEADAERALAIDPGSAEAMFRRGRLRVHRVLYKARFGLDPTADAVAAEADLTRVLAHGKARTWRGILRAERGDFVQRSGGDARADFAAAEADLTPPQDDFARLRRGWLRTRMGKLAEAEADFEAVLPKRPDMEWLWLWWGQARLRAGDLAGAEARLDEALRIGPRLAEALEARGRVRLARGRRAEALDDLERAIRANDALEPTLRPLIRSLRVGAGGGGPAGPGR